MVQVQLSAAVDLIISPGEDKLWFTSFSTGAGIFLTGDNAIVEDNILRGNRYGVNTASPFTFTIQNNIIGEDPLTGAANGNTANVGGPARGWKSTGHGFWYALE